MALQKQNEEDALKAFRKARWVHCTYAAHIVMLNNLKHCV